MSCCCTSKDSGCMDDVDPRLWYPTLDISWTIFIANMITRATVILTQPGRMTKHQHSSNQHISISFSQQHEVKDSPRSVSLTDSMEAFSNKLCAANRAACASSFRPASRNFRLAARPCSVAIRRTGPQVTWASQSQNYDTILCSRFSRGSNHLAATSGRHTAWLLLVRLG